MVLLLLVGLGALAYVLSTSKVEVVASPPVPRGTGGTTPSGTGTSVGTGVPLGIAEGEPNPSTPETPPLPPSETQPSTPSESPLVLSDTECVQILAGIPWVNSSIESALMAPDQDGALQTLAASANFSPSQKYCILNSWRFFSPPDCDTVFRDMSVEAEGIVYEFTGPYNIDDLYVGYNFLKELGYEKEAYCFWKYRISPRIQPALTKTPTVSVFDQTPGCLPCVLLKDNLTSMNIQFTSYSIVNDSELYYFYNPKTNDLPFVKVESIKGLHRFSGDNGNPEKLKYDVLNAIYALNALVK